MKAAELGIKAALILDGSLGWWDKLLQTHRPLTDIKFHAVLKSHYAALENHDPALVASVTTLEKLVPSRAGGGNFDPDTEANPEYPFFYIATSAGTPTSHLVGPSQYFTDTDSAKHFQAARRLLTAYRVLYPQVRAWRIRLPGPV